MLHMLCADSVRLYLAQLASRGVRSSTEGAETTRDHGHVDRAEDGKEPPLGSSSAGVFELEYVEAFQPRGPIAAAVLRWFAPPFLRQFRLVLPRPVLRLLCWLLTPDTHAAEICDGNVNYSFCVTGRNGLRLFVKQAEAHLKWQPHMLLERCRMAREVSYYRDARSDLDAEFGARLLPKIHYFDTENTVLVMEFFDGYTLLLEHLFTRGGIPDQAADSLGQYLGQVHARTAARNDRHTRQRAAAYWNASLRGIQLEHVFTACFTLHPAGRELAADETFMREVESLKAKYLGYSFDELDIFALCHGDFHPGSVMICGDAVKVIDPEFTIFGPPALDVGSLLFGFVLSLLFHLQQAQRPCLNGNGAGDNPHKSSGSANGRVHACGSTRASDSAAGVNATSARVEAAAAAAHIAASLGRVWRRYERTLAAEGFSPAAVRRVSEDAIGFALIELTRTSLGFAGARDPGRRIACADALRQYQRTALDLVRTCMHRRRHGGMQVLIDELEMLLAATGAHAKKID